jgi:hypothetical protein
MSKRGNVSSRSGQPTRTNVELSERIQSILKSKGLTLYQVSQQSAALYGRSSPYFLPHNLYYDLRHGAFTPGIYQVFALSRISGYRLSDWVRVFGIDLEDVARLQTLIPRKRTILVDASLTDFQAWVGWFRNRPSKGSDSSVMPLPRLLEPAGITRIGSIAGTGTRRFLYVKIGAEDALAFPDLLPGSIVRINPDLRSWALPDQNGGISDHIFLLEHRKGLFCSRVHRVEQNVITPVGTELAFAQIELRFPVEARLLGAADLEVRSLLKVSRPAVPNDLAKRWNPMPLGGEQGFGQLLRRTRAQGNMSFREAAAMSRTVSDTLGDPRYRISPSSLCDYELLGIAPRSLHKIVTLCCIYGLQFQTLLSTIKIAMGEAGNEAMPDAFIHRIPRTAADKILAGDSQASHSGFLGQLLDACEEVPFFLRDAIAPFAGLRGVSLDDFFWIGGEQDVLNPYFTDGLLALVNRRRKTPFHFPSKPVWKQPVYLLLERDGKYVCVCCGLEDGTLVIHPYTEQFHRAVQFGHHKDIEVVGQIVAIARKLT